MDVETVRGSKTVLLKGAGSAGADLAGVNPAGANPAGAGPVAAAQGQEEPDD